MAHVEGYVSDGDEDMSPFEEDKDYGPEDDESIELV